MINALLCTYKSGDVLPLSLKPLVDCPAVTRILIADGPHNGPISPGIKFDKPSVEKIVRKFNSPKIIYEYTDCHPNRALKNNSVLKHTTDDCKWILNVDSDEVYHEEGLKRLIEYLIGEGRGCDKYRIKTIDPMHDFFHEIRIPDWKPRLYKYKKGNLCPPGDDRAHQYVVPPETFSSFQSNFQNLPEDICKIYHLNALRNVGLGQTRVSQSGDKYVWKGGNRKFESVLYEIDKKEIPQCVLNLKKDTLWTT